LGEDIMNEELLKILERIASALESIAESLNRENQENISNNFNYANSQTYVNKNTTPDESEDILNRRVILANFLINRRITIKDLPEDENGDGILDKIAFFMGDRYKLIHAFLQQIKRKMNSGETVKMYLKERTQEEISSICQLASWLHEIAFLSEFTYYKSPKYLLLATPNRIPKALNFFSGKWFERYIKNQIISLIRQVNPSIKFSYLANPQISFANGDDFELDLLFEIEGEIFWFEIKSGDYQRYVEKYSKVSKMLNLDKNHSFMVLLDITEPGAQALKNLFHMNVVNLENFSKEFLNQIQKYQITEVSQNE
jgi:hypothetical protein